MAPVAPFTTSVVEPRPSYRKYVCAPALFVAEIRSRPYTYVLVPPVRCRPAAHLRVVLLSREQHRVLRQAGRRRPQLPVLSSVRAPLLLNHSICNSFSSLLSTGMPSSF